jgi:hypothetical protein
MGMVFTPDLLVFFDNLIGYCETQVKMREASGLPERRKCRIRLAGTLARPAPGAVGYFGTVRTGSSYRRSAETPLRTRKSLNVNIVTDVTDV